MLYYGHVYIGAQLSEQDYAGSESDGAVEVEVVLYGRVLNDVYLRLNVLTLEDAAMKRNNSLSSFLSGIGVNLILFTK